MRRHTALFGVGVVHSSRKMEGLHGARHDRQQNRAALTGSQRWDRHCVAGSASFRVQLELTHPRALDDGKVGTTTATCLLVRGCWCCCSCSCCLGIDVRRYSRASAAGSAHAQHAALHVRLCCGNTETFHFQRQSSRATRVAVRTNVDADTVWGSVEGAGIARNVHCGQCDGWNNSKPATALQRTGSTTEACFSFIHSFIQSVIFTRAINESTPVSYTHLTLPTIYSV